VSFDSFSFDQKTFDQRILAGIRAAGYTTPTPIQTQAIPEILAGHDIMGLAQTGTGKTAAFVLPILQRLLRRDAGRRGPIRVLVLAPTRELAVQIHETFVALGRETGFRCAVVIGGVGAMPQVKALRQASIVVACPGRLLDLMNQGSVDLSAVSTLVLDEADRMLDMGFLPDVRRILARLPRERQTLLFSATMPSEVNGLAKGEMRSPAVIQVSNTAPAATVSHALYPVAASRKQALLEDLLAGLAGLPSQASQANQANQADLAGQASRADLASRGQGSALVFTRTKHRAKSLAKKLDAKGFTATALQGNLSQNRRQEAMEGFKNGKYRVMVATDIAARGIDCERVALVVNFDLPDTAEAYTHRIGRTGRAERSGEAVSLVTAEDESQVRFIERSLGLRIERKRLEGFAEELAHAPQAHAQTHAQTHAPQERVGTRRPAAPARQQRTPKTTQRTPLDNAATKSLLPARSGNRDAVRSQGAPGRCQSVKPAQDSGPAQKAQPKAASSAEAPRQPGNGQDHGHGRPAGPRGKHTQGHGHSGGKSAGSGADRWEQTWSKVLPPVNRAGQTLGERDSGQAAKAGQHVRRERRPSK